MNNPSLPLRAQDITQLIRPSTTGNQHGMKDQ
ncbi:hypothetical protein LOK49_LG02G02598 [Camellia lanceoleosa]|uniref:Uncharacterized protein n=1 Tax=Camellia lanceoleosa TaxID=1840588 RepID=A0ACC0IQS7_9ERIC|nr:hypothetical protein LOK49_LG02G02598 [Camellia lanceoleosa]